MANPRLPNITEAEQELLYEKLNVYNQGKPLIRRRDVTLWFYRGKDIRTTACGSTRLYSTGSASCLSKI